MIDYSELGSPNGTPGLEKSGHASTSPITEIIEEYEKLGKIIKAHREKVRQEVRGRVIEREGLVWKMRSERMTLREIGDVIGVTATTVAGYLRAAEKRFGVIELPQGWQWEGNRWAAHD